MSRQPQEELIMSGPKFQPLSDIVRDEDYQEPTEPAVVDDSKPVTEKAAEIIPNEADKFEPLSKLKGDAVGDDNEEVLDNQSEIEEKGDNEQGSVDVNDVFSFFTENNLINIPEGFQFDGKEETFNKVLEYDQQVRDIQAINRIEQSIQDPRIFEIIQHGINGGKFADIEKIFDVTKNQLNLETLDVTNEADAEKILRKYYKEVSKFSDDRANKFVNVAKEQDMLEQEAKEAVEHYKQFYTDEQKRLNKEVVERKQQVENEFKLKAQGVAQAVKEIGYQGEVYKNVAMLMAPVIDSENNNQQVYKDNGQPMLWYEVIVDQISENPAHLAQLLGLLQGYEPNAGFKKIEKHQQKVVETEKTKSAFNSFNKLGRTKAGAAVGGNPGQYVPPAPDSYDL